jgi:hypothetical protein
VAWPQRRPFISPRTAVCLNPLSFREALRNDNSFSRQALYPVSKTVLLIRLVGDPRCAKEPVHSCLETNLSST